MFYFHRLFLSSGWPVSDRKLLLYLYLLVPLLQPVAVSSLCYFCFLLLFFVGVSVLFCALWTSASIRSLILDISSSVLAFLSSNCSGLDYRSVTSRRLRIQGYSRDSLLSLFTPTAPTYGVQQRLHELGLWTVCRLADHNKHSTVYLRRYRGNRAGRLRRPVPRHRPVGNGAFIVNLSVCHGRDDARSAVRALAQSSTSLSRRRLMRIPAVLLSVLLTSVRWRTRLTIC